MATIGDTDYDFTYTYSILGNLTPTQDLTGLAAAAIGSLSCVILLILSK